MAGVVLAVSVPTVPAADGVWTNPGSGNWSESGKWKDGVVADGADATATIAASITVNTNAVVLDSSRQIGTLAFSDPSTQNNEWTLSDATNDAVSLTLTNTTATPPTIIVSNSAAYIDVVLAGGQGLLVQGGPGLARYLVLRRTNTYAGATTIRCGEVLLGTNALAGGLPGSLGTDVSPIQIGDAGTLDSDNLGLRLSKFVTLERDIDVNSYGSNVIIGAADDTSAFNRTFRGRIRLGRDVFVTCGSNGRIGLESLVSGSGGLTINPYGNSQSTVDIYNTNTYSGATVVSRGVLNIHTNVIAGENGALGNATSDVVLGDGLTGGNPISLFVRPGLTFSRGIRVPAAGVGNSVYIGAMNVGTVRFTGDIRADRRVLLTAGTTAYRPVFSGTISGTGTVETSGTGEIVLEGTNTFTGDFVHSVGNSRVYIGQGVASGQPGPLGNSTNPVYFRVAGPNLHYLWATNTLVFSRAIRIEDGARTQLGAANALTYPEFSGDIDFAGELAVYAADNAQLRLSGRLTTATSTLFVAGNSSLANLVFVTNPSNRLSGAVSIGQAARLVVESSGALHGATQIVFAASSGVNPSALFAGDGVTLTQAVYMPLTLYAASTLVDIGMRTNGAAVFAGPVSLFRTNTTPIVNFTAPSGGVARFTQPVGGFFQMRKTGLGTVSLEGAGGWTNDTELTAGTVRGVDGVGLPAASRLVFVPGNAAGGVFESQGTFTRSLGPDAGQVYWFTNNTGHGGFAACGAKLTVDLNGGGPDNLLWGSTTGFVRAGNQLRFGSPYADSEVEFVDNIDLTNAGTIVVYDNPATRADKVALSGILSGGRPLTKSGPGVLALDAVNTVTGAVTVSSDGGALLVNGELPANGGTLTVNSNGFLGGTGTIRTRTIVMRDGSGFDWADEPGMLTITNRFSFPTNGVFRFGYGPGGAARVHCASTLTLPTNATVVIAPLGGFAPVSAVILSSSNTIGDPSGWTLVSNSPGYVISRFGQNVVLWRGGKGGLISIR